MITYLWLLAGLLAIAACVISWMLGANKFRKELNKAEAELQELRVEKKNRDTMEEQFTQLSKDVLIEQGKTVREQAEEKITSALNPMHKRYEEFRVQLDRLVENASENNNDFKNKMELMDKHINTLSDDARDLVTAIRGDSKTRGDWGELILDKYLENAGFSDKEYARFVERQRTFKIDGKLVRPDIVLNFPDGRSLVVDSKVSLTAFQNYVKAKDDSPECEQAKKDMKAAMKKQVEEISKKYINLPGVNTPGFAIMFTPIEPAWQLAVAEFPDLITEARQQGVIITGPTTLMAVLRLVSELWRARKSSESVNDIVVLAGKMHDNVAQLMGHITKIKDRARLIVNESEALTKRCEEPNGIVAHAVKMRSLGALHTKEIPSEHTKGVEQNSDLDTTEIEK